MIYNMVTVLKTKEKEEILHQVIHHIEQNYI
ncbi:hypothetical protein JOC93_000794 [Priestia taiwanensis]|nr:hypothetical protein [Priestia taiwanensis]